VYEQEALHVHTYLKDISSEYDVVDGVRRKRYRRHSTSRLIDHRCKKAQKSTNLVRSLVALRCSIRSSSEHVLPRPTKRGFRCCDSRTTSSSRARLHRCSQVFGNSPGVQCSSGHHRGKARNPWTQWHFDTGGDVQARERTVNTTHGILPPWRRVDYGQVCPSCYRTRCLLSVMSLT
jgi:hypothetical protein